MPERPDPMTERLSRFTPNAAGLDRDAILFAAGRQSARSHRIWASLAGLLAISQGITLFALWPRSVEVLAPTPVPTVQTTPDLSLPPPSPSPDFWSAGSRPEVLLKESPSANAEYIPPGPTLTVASGLHFE